MAKDIQKWADKAMYESKPIESTRPKVTLISMTPDPLGVIAIAAKVYKGEYAADLSEITDEERLSYFNDMTKTTLNAAFETVDFHFRIEGVTRAFTHQLVRQRTAVYFQESMRFAVINEALAGRTGLPPSLQNTQSHDDFFESMAKQGLDPALNCTDEQRNRNTWDKLLDAVGEVYETLVNNGMPAEEARGLLPTNILTRVQYKTNLRNLVDHAGMRLCTQAQFEWRYVFSEIARSIREAEIITPVMHDEGRAKYRLPVFMADQIADRLFRPVCYQTGKCAFEASFDRGCKIRERVQANARVGRNSSEWHKSSLVAEETDWENEVVEVGNGVGYGRNDQPVKINAIHPAEWMVDDSAARS